MKIASKAGRRQLILTLAAVFALVIGCFIYMVQASQTYLIELGLSPNDLIDGTATVELSEEGIVDAAPVMTQMEEDGFISLNVFVKSLQPGSVDVTIRWDCLNMDDGTVQTIHSTDELYVTQLGMIYDKTTDNFNGIHALMVLVIGLMVITAVSLIISIIRRKREGDFSYSMVGQCGVVVFNVISALIITVEWIAMMIHHMSPNFNMVVELLLETGKIFAYLTIIPLGLLALSLALSNIMLVRHEGFRIQNLLGIFLGIVLLIAIVTMYILNHVIIFDSLESYYITTLISILFAFSYCYFECMLISTIVCAAICTRYQPPYNLDYIIILGCAIRADGTPTPLLRGRADRALQFGREQIEKTGKRVVYVPSGGQGSDEVMSESQSMANYLMEQGIPAERICMEDRSTNTFQNMAYSKAVIENHADDMNSVNIGFSTTNYHVFRGYTLADKLKMKVKGLSAKTKLYFFPNAFLREFIGLLWEQRVRHIVFIVLQALFLAAIYLVVNL